MRIDRLPLGTSEEIARYISAAKQIFGDQFVEIAREGNLSTLEGQARAVKLLAMGVDVNHHGRYGNTALHYTVDSEHQDALKWLLELGANPNLGNDLGDTTLHWALKGIQDQDAIYTLLSAGANPRHKNHAGETPIDVSTYDGPVMDAVHSAASAYEARKALEELSKPLMDVSP